ncbi:MAG: hypothetical protein Q9214_002324, partial [Letrouitia sp. 1 TL-2023]
MASVSLLQSLNYFQAAFTRPRSRTTRSQDNVPAPFHLKSLNSIDLYEVSIAELQQHYTSGTFTAIDYVQFCLDRIRVIDPYLEAVIEVNPDALEIAVQLDEERKRGRVRGSLHGIPVLVKDNMATKDKMQTTAGSWALLGSVVPRDAFVVARLRQEGAIILGHAIHDRMGISPIEVLDPTDGSIVGPAQINSVVGIKPTPGLTSRSGIIPSSQTLDTVGPLGRSVQDAVLGLNAIVGRDERDPLTTSESRHQEKDYTQFMSDKKSLRGAKFGLPIKRCWEFVKEDQKREATRIFDGIIKAGGEIVHLNYQCAEERIAANGKWD